MGTNQAKNLARVVLIQYGGLKKKKKRKKKNRTKILT